MRVSETTETRGGEKFNKLQLRYRLSRGGSFDIYFITLGIVCAGG
jgi:hypothetical protein